MISELQKDVLKIALSIIVALISKIMDSISSVYTLFAIINLISLLYFVKSVINFIEHKYNLTILRIPSKIKIR